MTPRDSIQHTHGAVPNYRWWPIGHSHFENRPLERRRQLKRPRPIQTGPVDKREFSTIDSQSLMNQHQTQLHITLGKEGSGDEKDGQGGEGLHCNGDSQLRSTHSEHGGTRTDIGQPCPRVAYSNDMSRLKQATKVAVLSATTTRACSTWAWTGSIERNANLAQMFQSIIKKHS
jgi:hypothetical protein